MTARRLLRISRHRLRSIVRKDDVDREVADELAFHRELLVREGIASGLPRRQAERRAAHLLGNVALLQEQCRDHRRVTWAHDLRQDLLYGIRVLRRSRGFAAIAIASLALGIGATTAVLSVARAVAFDALPYPAGDRLVVVRTYESNQPARLVGAPIAAYLAWRDRGDLFESIGVSHGFPGDLGGDAGEPPDRIDGYAVDRAFLETLGAQPIAGRLFQDAEGTTGVRPLVISERLWRRRFGADRAIAGRHVRLNRQPAVIVGVLPATFAYPDQRIEYWTPMRLPEAPELDASRSYSVVGRLTPGVTGERVESELDGMARRIATERPHSTSNWRVRATPLRAVQYRWTWEPLLTLGLSVTLALVLACVNLAGMLLARNAARRPELALRLSLGAGRGRIVRQLITESLLLSFMAGAGGSVVAWWSARAIRTIAPLPGLAPMPLIAIDAGVLAVVLLLSVATCLAFGVAPALAASRAGEIDPFRADRTASADAPRRQRAWSALVAVQVALALVLLIGAGLLVNTVARVASRDIGFDTSNLMTFDFQMVPAEFLHPAGSYRGAQVFDIHPPPPLAFARMLERVAAIPGVESAAGISHHPLTSFVLVRMPLGGVNGAGEAAASPPVHFLVTPRFFSTMKATIVRGREIGDSDVGTGAWVAVVNETMARQYWPGRDPIGQQFVLDTLPDERPRQIVGVVRDLPTRREQTIAEPVFYTSYLQQLPRTRAPWAGMGGRMTFFVRTAGDPLRLVADVRRAIATIEPDRPLTAVSKAELGNYFWFRKAHVLAVAGFALVATLLAALGLYGILACTLARRTREIAIRVALGAGAVEVIRAIGLPSLRVVSIGLAAGIAGAIGFGRLIESQLWGITATDPPTFVAAAALLVTVTGLACVPPIRRARRIDPAVALKAE